MKRGAYIQGNDKTLRVSTYDTGEATRDSTDYCLYQAIYQTTSSGYFHIGVALTHFPNDIAPGTETFVS